MERRGFIRQWGRWVLLGGFVTGAGYLLATGRVSKDAECAGSGACHRCSKQSSCSIKMGNKSEIHGK